MKNMATILAGIFLLIVLGLYMCTFQVRFTEVAIVKTWGKPAKDAITKPGLQFKWPAPIQSVVVYDKRIRTLEDRTEETRTVDGKNILLTTFTLWRIADPSKFHTNFPESVRDGENKLRTTAMTHKQAVVGQRAFEAFVSTDQNTRKLREIEKEIEARVAEDVTDDLGIDIVGFGIKKLGLPQSVTSAIFDNMKAGETKRAREYIAEGDAEATRIQAEAKATEARILAAADGKVREIEAEAEERVSAYYKEFDKHPQLRIFLDKLRTVRAAFSQRTTLILDTEQSPFDVFSDEKRSEVRPAGTN